MSFSRVVDEAGLRRYQHVLEVSFAADFVALPADPIADIRPALSGRLNSDSIELWIATDGEDVVAAVTIRFSVLDNLDLINLDVRVHPAHRSRGHGRAAVDAALARCQELGRTRVLGEVPTHTKAADPAPGVAFARSLGARRMHTEIRRVLDLRELTSDRLAALADEARHSAAGYSTLTWGDHTPIELVEDMAGLLALMSTDPPQGELEMEPEVWTAERYLKRERSVIARGRRHLVVAARDDRTGRLAGFTDLATPGGGVPVGYQWATIVHRDHRGHRLGMLMKAINLQQLLVAMPEVRYLNTWNAAENTYMVAVNEALGYRPIEGWSEWQLDL